MNERGPVVSVIQFDAALGDIERNLAQAEAHIRASSGRSDLILFPELFTTGYNLAKLDFGTLAEPLDGPTLERLSKSALDAGVAVVGTVIEASQGELFDTAIVVNRAGELAGSYRKSHLHPTETEHFTAGTELAVVELGDLRVGLAICFEHAFPEIFAELALAGANVIAIPSAVREGYGYLMDLRTRARAQDNQVFVAAANLAGFDGTTRWCGRSAIVDPRGELLAYAGSAGPARLSSQIDLGAIERERNQEPVFANRRPEIYRRLRRAAP